MSTFNEIIQRVQSLYSKGVQSDDARLEKRQIYPVLLSIRAKLLQQQANKKQKISAWNEQTIPCIKLIPAEPYECPCLPPVGCKILRTEQAIPRPISDMDRPLISSVTSLTGHVNYSPTTWTEKKYKSGNKYTGSKPDYYIRNNYLYITHKIGPRIITITGVFEDPFEVSQYASLCEEQDCEDCQDCLSPLDLEVPVDSSMVETIVNMCVQELLVIFNQSTEDRSNNTADNIVEQSK